MAPAISSNHQDLGDLLKQHEGFEKAAASSVTKLRGRVYDLVAKVRHSQQQLSAVTDAKSAEQSRALALRDAVSAAAQQPDSDPDSMRLALLAAVSAFDNHSVN